MSYDEHALPAVTEADLEPLRLLAKGIAISLHWAGKKPDGFFRDEQLVPSPGIRGRLFGVQVKATFIVRFWDMQGCEAADIEAMVLTEGGDIFFDSAFPLLPDRESGVPMMQSPHKLSPEYFRFVRIEEVEARLEALAERHGILEQIR